MTVLENLLVAQHNPLMRASGLTFLGIIGLGLARLKEEAGSQGVAERLHAHLPVPGGYRAAEEEAMAKAVDWLRMTGLLERADDPAAELPYGAQRRLEIARAMCTDPVLLCLDEPAAGLNPRESAELNELLLSIRDRYGTSILLIEHDMSVVMEISDHVIVLDYGVKIADGTPDEIRHDEHVIAAYLGVEEAEVKAVEAEVGL
jgi:branched-chain amino acid transport system ATP-binding protein